MPKRQKKAASREISEPLATKRKRSYSAADIEGWSGIFPTGTCLPAGTDLSSTGSREEAVNRLPNELLAGIFSLLDTSDQDAARRVCRRWDGVIRDVFVCSTLRFSSLTNDRRCSVRSDIWNPCWSSFCRQQRRTMVCRAQVKNLVPHRLVFARPHAGFRTHSEPEDPETHLPMPCGLWMFVCRLPADCTQLILHRTSVRLDELLDCGEKIKSVRLRDVELKGISSLMEIPAARNRYMFVPHERFGPVSFAFDDISYSIVLDMAEVNRGDRDKAAFKGMWFTLIGERVDASTTKEQSTEWIRAIRTMVDGVQGEDLWGWEHQVDVFVKAVVRMYTPEVQAELPLMLETFDWSQLPVVSLKEIFTGLKHIVREFGF